MGIASAQAQGTLVRRWGEMIKFSHSIFALPFALMATFLAARAAQAAGDAQHPWPTPIQFGLIVACMVTARSAAMTFNRIADAAIDARNPRTAGRALPAGTISRRQALGFLFAARACSSSACGGFYWLYGNRVPLMLSLPVLAYLCFYSYTKRFTRWSHFVLGSAIAFCAGGGVAGDSSGVHRASGGPADGGGDALDRRFRHHLRVPGHRLRPVGRVVQPAGADRPGRALWIARAAHAGTVLLLLGLMPVADLGGLYLAGVVVVAVLLVVENALVRADDFSRVNVAFFTVNGVISLLLAVLTIADVLV